MAKMISGAPAQKVMASSIGAAIAAIVVFFLPEVPAEGDLSVAHDGDDLRLWLFYAAVGL